MSKCFILSFNLALVAQRGGNKPLQEPAACLDAFQLQFNWLYLDQSGSDRDWILCLQGLQHPCQVEQLHDFLETVTHRLCLKCSSFPEGVAVFTTLTLADGQRKNSHRRPGQALLLSVPQETNAKLWVVCCQAPATDSGAARNAYFELLRERVDTFSSEIPVLICGAFNVDDTTMANCFPLDSHPAVADFVSLVCEPFLYQGYTRGMDSQEDYKFTFHGGAERGSWRLSDYVLLNGKNDSAKFLQPPVTMAFRYQAEGRTWYVSDHKALFTSILIRSCGFPRELNENDLCCNFCGWPPLSKQLSSVNY